MGTIAGCVKQYFRDLSKPLMTYRLYNDFIGASKHKDEEERIREICQLLKKLPVASREMLKVLIRHLNKVSLKSDKNLMTASNLSVCFGPTLLWPKEKTVASIMDIKFCNEVIEILIENCDRMFPSVESSPEFLLTRKFRTSADSPSLSSCKTPPKVRRSQSFSLFSELSTSSLPEIKEFNQEKLDRPRSKSHQHEIPPRPPPKEHSPITLGQMSSSEQDELKASLEMMTSLAADLPSTTMQRQWSYTLQNRRNKRTPTREVTRKPPLPKLSIQPLSPSTPPSTPILPLHFPPSNQNPRNQSFLRQNSSPVSITPEPAFKRPKDFPIKLVSTMDRLHTVPRQNKRASDRNLVIEETMSGEPPPIPVRKYKNILKDQTVYEQNNGTHVNASSESPRHPNSLSDNLSPTHETEFRINTSTPLKILAKPDANTHGMNHSVDSGVLSPSPPCVLSHLTKPQHERGTKDLCENRQKQDQADGSHSEDGLSLLSCSLSETSDLSESKYDNVHFHLNNNEEDEHPLKDKKLDEFEGSDCSSILGNLVLGSSESDIGNCECSERNQLCNRQKNNYNQTHYLDNRDSGPYENVQQQTNNQDTRTEGRGSLGHMLDQGKTTNV